MRTEQNILAEKFLLGKLDEVESIKIEKKYFNNKAFFEEILIAENDLIDAYVTGIIPSQDQKLFEKRLLINPRQRERVNFAKTLAKYTSSLPLPEEDLNTSTSKPSWRSFISQLISNKPMLSFSFSVAAIIVFVGGIWLAFDTNTTQDKQTGELAVIKAPQIIENRESINERIDDEPVVSKPKITPSPRKSVQTKSKETTKEVPQKPNSPAVFAIILSSGLTRDSETSQKFIVPANTDFVKMQLKIEENNFSSYQAVLETVEGNQIWNSNKLKSKSNKTVNISIPSKLLKKNDYILSLKGLTEDGIYERVEDYIFTIETPKP